MYTPPKFQAQSKAQVKEFIKNNGFAMLCSTHKDRPWVSHIPLVMTTRSDGQAVLQGHVSKGNQQWKTIEGQEVLCVFQGAHAYVSSSWYDHVNVPTWNYIAVHVYGKAKILNAEELLQSLHTLVDKYEAHSKEPFHINQMPPEMLKNELRGIVGIEIEISDVQAAFKLSQNRDDENQKRIIHQLAQKDDQSKQIADWMSDLND